MKRRAPRARRPVVPEGLPSDADLDAAVRGLRGGQWPPEILRDLPEVGNGHAPAPPAPPHEPLQGETLHDVLDAAFMRLLRSLDGDSTVKVADHVKALEAASKWAALDVGQGWGAKLRGGVEES